MPNCGAPNCTNRSGDKENLSFHRIPKKEDLRKKWVHNLNRKILAKNIFVCSDHFEPSCFKRDLRCELMNAKPKMLLEGDAVPTIFDHAPRKRICLIEKSGKTAKIQIIEEALVEHETEILSKQTEVCCSTEDLIVVKDASVQMKQKSYKSIRTQYRENDFIDSDDEIVKGNKSLKVKINKSTKFRDIAINTDLTFMPNDRPESKNFIDKGISDADDEDTSQEEISDGDDEIYHPSTDSLAETDDEDSYKEINAVDLPPGTKLIVFWSCLTMFFNICHTCYQPAKISKIFYKGTMVIVDIVCELKHRYSWHSQPNVNGRAAGNISIASSIILCGGTYERFSEMFKTATVSFFSHTTFYRIQKKLVIPAIHRLFTTQRQLLFDDAKERGSINLLGDGRCDSPGYNAKYGTYTIMDSFTGMILDMHVSHVGLTVTSARI